MTCFFSCFGTLKRSAICIAILVALAHPAWTQGSPAFATQTPESGAIGNTFVVLLPIVNSGTAPASLVRVTSVTLGRATLISPALTLPLGTMVPNVSEQLVLQFSLS